MTTMALRAELHRFIEITGEEKIKALYTLLKDDIADAPGYSQEEISMLHERVEEYRRGNTQTYTPEESHKIILH